MRLLLVALLFAATLSSCRKKPAPAPPIAPPEALATVKEPTLNELNDALQAWFTSRGQAPASLEELAKARFISKVPTPPPGREYVIDAQNLRVVVR